VLNFWARSREGVFDYLMNYLLFKKYSVTGSSPAFFQMATIQQIFHSVSVCMSDVPIWVKYLAYPNLHYLIILTMLGDIKFTFGYTSTNLYYTLFVYYLKRGFNYDLQCTEPLFSNYFKFVLMYAIIFIIFYYSN
jgi:hypothetical protein